MPDQKQNISVCFSPELISSYSNEESVVVVIDVLRATSAICTAIHHGAKEVIPVVNVDVAREHLNKGYIVGAERGGEIVDGFEYGNSPFSFNGEHVKDKTIVLSTTNGTFAIGAAQTAYEVMIASFLNLDAVARVLADQQRDIVLLCAGWRNKFNMEDALLAGALIEQLLQSKPGAEFSDSAIAACKLYGLAKSDLNSFLKDSSHRKRLERLHIERDIEYCLTLNQTDTIPVLRSGAIVKMSEWTPSEEL